MVLASLVYWNLYFNCDTYSSMATWSLWGSQSCHAMPSLRSSPCPFQSWNLYCSWVCTSFNGMSWLPFRDVLTLLYSAKSQLLSRILSLHQGQCHIRGNYTLITLATCLGTTLPLPFTFNHNSYVLTVKKKCFLEEFTSIMLASY